MVVSSAYVNAPGRGVVCLKCLAEHCPKRALELGLGRSVFEVFRSDDSAATILYVFVATSGILFEPVTQPEFVTVLGMRQISATQNRDGQKQCIYV